MTLQLRRGRVTALNGSPTIYANIFSQFKDWNGIRFNAQDDDSETPGEHIHSVPGGGIVTEALTSLTVKDGSKTWSTDQWQKFQVLITDGVGAGEIRTISSNTATTLTVSVPFTGIPNVGASFVIIGAGTATSGAAGILNDTTQNWTTNQFQNWYIHIVSGQGAGQVHLVVSNTATQIIAPFVPSVNNTSVYRIAKSILQLTDVDEPLGNLYTRQNPTYLDNLPADNEFLYGVVSLGQGKIIDTGYSLDFSVEGVAVGHLFSIVETAEAYAPYHVGGNVTAGSFDLTAPYAGITRHGVLYVIHTDFDSSIPDLPLPNATSLDLGLIVRRGFIALATRILGMGASFLGNAYKSLRVNATETGVEMIELLPVDGSRPMTGQLVGLGSDPTLANHLTRKAYVDGLIDALVDRAGVRGMLNPLTLDYYKHYASTVGSATTTIVYSTGTPLVDDQFNAVPSGTNGHRLRMLTGACAGQIRDITDVVASTQGITVALAFNPAPSAGDLFDIIRGAEDRLAASRGYVTQSIVDVIANPVFPYYDEWIKVNTQQIAPGAAVDVEELSGLVIPGADGIRQYVAELQFAYFSVTNTSPAGRVQAAIVVNETGTGSTGIVWIVNFPQLLRTNDNLGQATHFFKTPVFVPASGYYIGVRAFLSGSAGSDIGISGGPTSIYPRCYLKVTEKLVRAS